MLCLLRRHALLLLLLRRCVMYTGHVTAGGSICVEALTCSGSPGSWQPDFSVEGLLNLVVTNMVSFGKVAHTESDMCTHARTPHTCAVPAVVLSAYRCAPAHAHVPARMRFLLQWLLSLKG
jgi:hypothetical protein